MDCLTLRDLRSTGYLLEIECVRCGSIEFRSPAAIQQHPAAAVGALGLGLACYRCGASACITSSVATL